MNDSHATLPLALAHSAGSSISYVVASARRAGDFGANALVWGEPGTGKEALARLIHHSERPDAPFRILELPGLGEDAVAARLFGPEQDGSPGGGLLDEASTGTVLIEEVGLLALSVQARLVRAMTGDDATTHASGASRPRLVATSTHDLLPAVSAGRFRRDLYDLLSAKLWLPPLRERRDDILAIFDHAWSALAEPRAVADAGRELIRQYAWPGNAREIAAFAGRLAAESAGSFVTVRDVERGLFTMVTGLSCWGAPDNASEGASSGPAEPPALAMRRLLEAGLAFTDDGRVDLFAVLRTFEDGLIEWALRRAGNKAGAAALLGIRRTTLVEKLRRRRSGTQDEVHAPLRVVT